MSYDELIRSIEEFEGRLWEGEYDISLNGETITIIIETNGQVIHHNKRVINSGFGSEWEWQTYKTEVKDGDRWKMNWYLDHDAPDLEKLLISQVHSEKGSILLFTKEEFLGVLELLDYTGVTFKEAE